MGFGLAACVRVGNALGAGNTEQATAASKVAIICACKNNRRLPSIEYYRVTGCFLFDRYTFKLWHLCFSCIQSSCSLVLCWNYTRIIKGCDWLHLHNRDVSMTVMTTEVYFFILQIISPSFRSNCQIALHPGAQSDECEGI